MSYRTYREIEGDDESGLMAQVIEQRARVGRRLASVERVVAVMSGKGGVGKSHVTARLAAGAIPVAPTSATRKRRPREPEFMIQLLT